jgi:hypothetical protein
VKLARLIPAAVLARRESALAQKHGFKPGRLIPGTNFRYGEVVSRSGATRLPWGAFRLPNGDTVKPWTNAIVHARAMQRLRNAINKERKRRNLRPTGIRINSWWRTWQHNQQVGGASKSMHMYFLACDITREEVRRLCPWGGFDTIADKVFSKGGFGQYPGGGRHVDSRGHRSRWTSF